MLETKKSLANGKLETVDRTSVTFMENKGAQSNMSLYVFSPIESSSGAYASLGENQLRNHLSQDCSLHDPVN